MSHYIVKCKKTYLKSPLSTTASSVVLKELVDSLGNNVAMSDFGDFGVIVVKQGDTIEAIKFSGLAQNTGNCTLTVASSGRNISPTNTYAGSSTGSAFQAGAEVIVTNDPLTMMQFGNLNNAQTWTLLQTFTVMPQSSDVPTTGDDLINKTYADGLVLGSLTTLNLIVPATAGATVAVDQLVYLDASDQEWKLCDADTASSVDNVILGITQGAGTDGNAITGGVLLRGKHTASSAIFTAGAVYASNTAGGFSSSAGTTEVSLGVADSTTTMFFSPRYDQMLTENQQDALAGNLGTPSGSDTFVTQTGLQKGAEIYGADAEASDTYVITLSPAPTAYYTGMVIHFKANTANTGACTINVNGLGAKSIKNNHDQDPADGDIESGQIVTLVYDGTNFQMQSQNGNVPLTTYTGNQKQAVSTGASITNSTTETAILSVSLAGNTLSTSNGIQLRIPITSFTTQIGGGAKTWTFRLKYGSTTLVTHAITGTDVSAGRGFIDVILLANSSTSAQTATMETFIMDQTTTKSTSASNAYEVSTGTATEDSTGALTLQVTAQLSSNNGSLATGASIISSVAS